MTLEPVPEQRSLRIDWNGDGSELVHIRQIRPAGEPRPGAVALCIPGAISDGRVFYTESGKGFAPFLARHGWETFVADPRGRGESRPRVSRRSRFGQTEAIIEELPRLIDWVGERRPGPLFLVAHSWGGVIAYSTLARRPEYRDRVAGLVLFGSKRSVRVGGWRKRLWIDLGWNGIGVAASALFGFLPARALGWGSDGETRRSHAQSVAWVRPGPWTDPADGFDYAAASRRGARLPPALWIAGRGDAVLGHPDDVARFREETGAQGPESPYWLLSRANGALRDYDHLEMLVHPDAPRDVFARVLAWMDATLDRRPH